MFKQMVIGFTCLLYIGNVAAQRLEVSAGQCSYTVEEQGVWWSQYQGTQFDALKLKAGCYQIGVSKLFSEVGKTSFGWRVSYVDLGKVKLEETAWSYYGPQPHWTANGSGETNGLSLGLLAERNLYGPFGFSVELGGYAYRSQWSATVHHNASGTFGNIEAKASHKATWYSGVGLSYKASDKWAVTLNTRRYNNVHANTHADNGDVIGPKSSSVMSFLAGLTYEF